MNLARFVHSGGHDENIPTPSRSKKNISERSKHFKHNYGSFLKLIFLKKCVSVQYRFHKLYATNVISRNRMYFVFLFIVYLINKCIFVVVIVLAVVAVKLQ